MLVKSYPPHIYIYIYIYTYIYTYIYIWVGLPDMWQPTDSFVLFTTQKQWKYLLNADTQDDSLLLPATKFSNFFFFFYSEKAPVKICGKFCARLSVRRAAPLCFRHREGQWMKLLTSIKRFVSYCKIMCRLIIGGFNLQICRITTTSNLAYTTATFIHFKLFRGKVSSSLFSFSWNISDFLSR